jgi:hypothetical protein
MSSVQTTRGGGDEFMSNVQTTGSKLEAVAAMTVCCVLLVNDHAKFNFQDVVIMI